MPKLRDIEQRHFDAGGVSGERTDVGDGYAWFRDLDDD
jgi:hypothetical protein